MIVEGGRTISLCLVGLKIIAFCWLTGFRDILWPKACWKKITGLTIFLLFVCLTAWPQNCDVEFPGSSNLVFSGACGGGTTVDLTLGNNQSMGNNDVFTFDTPATINISGNLEVFSDGDGNIVIPAGVTVIVEGDLHLNAKNGGCESGSPCTLMFEVNGYLLVNGDLNNNVVTLFWTGTGTVEVRNRFENGPNGCMVCGLQCPYFPAGSECRDSGSGCGSDFCATVYGNSCFSDNIDPIISNCPADILISTSDCSGTTVNWTAPTATDNCSIFSFTSSHNSGDTFPLGTTTVTYLAIDDQGNTASCSFLVEVKDDLVPIITNCPANVIVSANPSSCETSVSWTPPLATDNCNIVSFLSSHQPGEVFQVGTTTVSYLATDEGGNSASCNFDVIVEDHQAPQISSCPANIIIPSFDQGASFATVNWTEPSATDNCAVSGFSSTHQPGAQFGKGLHVVSYIARDSAGNSTECSFTVEVQGNSLPEADDISIQTQGSDPIVICFIASDDDGDDITLTEIDYQGSGSISQIDPIQWCFTFTPLNGFSGSETVAATICDDNDPAGCIIVNAVIEVLPEVITVYKVISPNGDAINDVWQIENIGQYPENRVTIFDRWGGVIYEASGYNNENIVWDGRGKGGSDTGSMVPAGTYFYSIQLEGAESKSGFVEVVR